MGTAGAAPTLMVAGDWGCHLHPIHGGGAARGRQNPQSLPEDRVWAGLRWAGDPSTCSETVRLHLTDCCSCTALRGQLDQKSIAGKRPGYEPSGSLEGKWRRRIWGFHSVSETSTDCLPAVLALA